MANTVIQLRNSTVTGNVPSSLANGEISINSRDGKFFYSTPAGTVITHYPYLGPAGLNKEIQFNDSGTLGSNSGLTFDKATGTFTTSIVASTNNGNGTNFKVGDDAWIGDVNSADTLRIAGQQNVNNAYIQFGASNANTLGRAGTGPLTYTGAFTATGILSGSEINSTLSSGDEGGQINLALAATNTSLSGSVAIDIFQNRLRIFETGGTNRGVFIDMANGASIGVGTNLLTPSSSTDGWARNQANASFLQANTPSYTANSAASYANSAFATANSAASYANSAFLKANTPSDVANSAASYANSAFIKANTAGTAANTPSYTANSAALYANAAFTRANNSLDANNGGTVTGTITATSFITTGSFGNIQGANTIYANNFVANTGFIQFADGSKQYTANAGSGGAGSDTYARNTANAAFIQANAAFAQANAGGTATDSWARNQANSAFNTANSAQGTASSAQSTADAAYYTYDIASIYTPNNSTTVSATGRSDTVNLVGTSGIYIFSNTATKTITVAGGIQSLPGAQGMTVDYGYVSEAVYYAIDYGTL